MTLDVKPEIAAALEALASARGLSVEDYLEQLVERELPHKVEDASRAEDSASAHGMSVEDYLGELLEKELPLKLEDAARSGGSGMVWENGLFVYRTGRPLPLRVVDDAIRQVREERAQHILGKHS
ncbi:MAG TPA: hypothetical protein VGR03_03440 [Candidatus Acidoferrum sp.]|nr:hypothetical protein [Candidatus Acidoferrum sp.]